jgi:predicted N-acyltransferase
VVRARPKGRELTGVLRLRVVPRIRDVPKEEWDALASERSSPFVEHTWLDCLEEAGCVGGDTGWTPRHLVLYEGGDVVAAAPAYLKTNSEGEFVFDWSWADLARRMRIRYYPKLVVSVPFTPAAGERVLVRSGRDRHETVAVFAEAARALVREHQQSSAHVLFPHEDEARAWSDAGFALRNGVQYHWSNAGYATFEDFLATLPQKKRTQIRRERKQPALDGVTLHTLGPEELTRDVARAMYRLYLTTVDKYFYGRRYLNERFFELVQERFAHRLAWVVAKRRGEIVASAFNVKKGDTLYGRYWGTNVELPFLHFNVCYYRGIDDAIRAGLATFNPGAGGEHKRVRGFAPTVTWSAHHLADARFRGIVDSFLEREREAIASYVAGEADEEP